MEKVETKEKEKKVKNKSNNSNSALVAVIAALVGAVCMYLLMYYVIPPIDNTKTVINKSEKEVTVTDEGIADAVEKLYDAVVVVELYQNNQKASSGTGFVYKTDNGKAYILTNNHVIQSSAKNTKVQIVLSNGSVEEANVEGSDLYADLAVLSIDEKKAISVAQIGATESMRAGDTVFTVGAPMSSEYSGTVTRGILSCKDRMIEVKLSNSYINDYVMKVLQTDAAINPGNSGGPIANVNGEVIGITNMKLVSDGFEGIGFAIPIEDAVSYAEKIINGEDTTRPMMGVNMANLSDKWSLYQEGITLNTTLTEGVVVVTVEKNSPAEKAGLKRGDIITEINGEKVENLAVLRYQLYKYSVGDTIKVTFERSEKSSSADVKLTASS